MQQEQRQPRDYWPIINRLYAAGKQLTWPEQCFISQCNIARQTYGHAMQLSDKQFDWLDRLKEKYEHLIKDHHDKPGTNKRSV